jgi:hypothetical protein
MNRTDALDTPRALLRGLQIPRTDPSRRYPEGDALPRFEPPFGIGSDGQIYLNAQRIGATLRELDGVTLFVGLGENLPPSLVDGYREFLQRPEPRVFGTDGVTYIKCHTRGSIVRAMGSGLPMFWGFAANAKEMDHLLRNFMVMAGELSARLPGGLHEILRLNQQARHFRQQEPA